MLPLMEHVLAPIQAPAGPVWGNVSVSSAKRGAVYPSTLLFTPDNWDTPKVSC